MELNNIFLILLIYQGVATTRRSLMSDVEEQETNSIIPGPLFDTSVPGNLTGLVGKTAHLNCRVKNLGNRTVSWIRHRDIHLLTVGRYTYTSDQRFESVHSPHTEDWTLRIRYPQKDDSGTYECQISTSPPVGHAVYLSIVEPTTVLLGGSEMFINIGSTINLTCLVSFTPEPPPTVIWWHNKKLINFDNSRDGISLVTEKAVVTKYQLLIQKADKTDSGLYTCGPTTDSPTTMHVHKLINFDNSRGGISLVTEKAAVTRSQLLIQKADKTDNGVYACDPTTASPATVHVHILNGELPAAMHHGRGSNLRGPSVVVALLLPLLTTSTNLL